MAADACCIVLMRTRAPAPRVMSPLCRTLHSKTLPNCANRDASSASPQLLGKFCMAHLFKIQSAAKHACSTRLDAMQGNAQSRAASVP